MARMSRNQAFTVPHYGTPMVGQNRIRSGRHRRPKKTREGSWVAFGAKVAVASLVAFLGILFSDQIPAAAQTAIRLANGHGRENTPPAGARYYGCDDARAAGVAPLYEGEPGYRPEMDGDGDGVACEPYYGS